MSTRSSMSFSESERLFGEALKVVAGGTTQAKSPENYIPGAYPIYVDHGHGAYLWDVDGNQFIDWILAYGTVVLGYTESAVDQAAIREIQEGFAFPLTRPVQNRLAELLIELVPSAELVHFFKSGSDSTSAAVRVARIFTGRDKIVRWGYTGWHDWACPKPAGIPDKVREDVITFRYNDLNSLEDILNHNKDQVACVIMMPFEVELPQPGFLEGVKALAHKHGALFIFDEMRSGFRMALGGAQEYYKVIPDMATFSKAIANGYEISVLVGRRDIMGSLKQTHVSSTFYTNSIAMAAAVATLERLKQGDVIPHLWKLGQGLLDGLNDLAKQNGIEAEAIGAPPMPYLIFTYDSGPTFSQTGQIGTSTLRSGSRNEKAWRTFYTETTRGGILLHPNHHWFVSAAHSQKELEQTLSVCADAFAAVRRAI